jgi:FAD-dependent oxidoreductase domain-containing protein 1
MKKAIYDTVIVGGGAMGSSVAYHLSRACNQRVLVIERDLAYSRSSFALSAGGIRQQFSLPENIQMSMYGIEFLKRLHQELAIDGDDPPDIQLKENGYLFLATKGIGEEVLTENNAIQRRQGADWIDVLSQEQLKEEFPWMSTQDIVLGSFSRKNEAIFDPWALVQALKRKAESQGVKFVQGDIRGASLDECSGRLKTLHMTNSKGDEEELVAEDFVNAAGAWSGQFMNLLTSAGSQSFSLSCIPVPVEPKKRCVFQFHCPPQALDSPPTPPAKTPLVVLPNGVYFRPDVLDGHFICGVSPPASADPACEDEALDIVDHTLFEEIIWPTLYDHVPAFGELKVKSSWAGFYDYNTLDQNAIVGRHPSLTNVVLCTGFSGHGLQHAPAAGRAVTELLLHDSFQTIDCQRFSFKRVEKAEPILETGIV